MFTSFDCQRTILFAANGPLEALRPVNGPHGTEILCRQTWHISWFQAGPWGCRAGPRGVARPRGAEARDERDGAEPPMGSSGFDGEMSRVLESLHSNLQSSFPQLVGDAWRFLLFHLP